MNRRDVLKGLGGLLAAVPFVRMRLPTEAPPAEVRQESLPEVKADKAHLTEVDIGRTFPVTYSYIELFYADGSDGIMGKTTAYRDGVPMDISMLHIFVNGNPTHVTKMADGVFRISPPPERGDMISVEYGATEDIEK